MIRIFQKVSIECSRILTQHYSTSFSLGILALKKRFRDPIYAIYGFVRLADEIVDTFHFIDQENMMKKLKTEVDCALENKFSINPVLQAFQTVVHEYQIDRELIDSFLKSMTMDLYLERHDWESYQHYIYGSAEAVGLMCLKIFCDGDQALYENLKKPAQHLGAAFQKVNFLRDYSEDLNYRKRIYFPHLPFDESMGEKVKKTIEQDILKDFKIAYEMGIKKLPSDVRFGVLTAYLFYYYLFMKIKRLSARQFLNKRIRLSNSVKIALMPYAFFKHYFNLI